MQNATMNNRPDALLTGVLALCLLFVLAGCSSLRSETGYDAQEGEAPTTPAPRYVAGLNDVLVPVELTLDTQNTTVFESGNFSAGMLTLTGKVSAASLAGFFRRSMTQTDGWILVGTITAPRTMMLFEKAARWCIIRISESSFSTAVEIAVLPAVSGAGLPDAPLGAIPFTPPSD